MDFEVQVVEVWIQLVGVLFDLMVFFGFCGFDLDKFWCFVGVECEVNYVLCQCFLFWGKCVLVWIVVSQDVVVVGFDCFIIVCDLLVDVEVVYVCYWYVDQVVVVFDCCIVLFCQVEEMVGVCYVLGCVVQQDVICVQVEQISFQCEWIECFVIKQEVVVILNVVLGCWFDVLLVIFDEVLCFVVYSVLFVEVLDDVDVYFVVCLQQVCVEVVCMNVVLQCCNCFFDIILGVGVMQFGNGIESIELMFEVEILFQQCVCCECECELCLFEDVVFVCRDVMLWVVEECGVFVWLQWINVCECCGLIENMLLLQVDVIWQFVLVSYQVGEVDFGMLLEVFNEWQGVDFVWVDVLCDELLGVVVVCVIEGEI